MTLLQQTGLVVLITLAVVALIKPAMVRDALDALHPSEDNTRPAELDTRRNHDAAPYDWAATDDFNTAGSAYQRVSQARRMWDAA